jgi:hypothetical protein
MSALFPITDIGLSYRPKNRSLLMRLYLLHAYDHPPTRGLPSAFAAILRDPFMAFCKYGRSCRCCALLASAQYLRAWIALVAQRARSGFDCYIVEALRIEEPPGNLGASLICESNNRDTPVSGKSTTICPHLSLIDSRSRFFGRS